MQQVNEIEELEFDDNQQQLHSQKSVASVRAKSRISGKQASEVIVTSPTPDNSKEV